MDDRVRVGQRRYGRISIVFIISDKRLEFEDAYISDKRGGGAASTAVIRFGNLSDKRLEFEDAYISDKLLCSNPISYVIRQASGIRGWVYISQASVGGRGTPAVRSDNNHKVSSKIGVGKRRCVAEDTPVVANKPPAEYWCVYRGISAVMGAD